MFLIVQLVLIVLLANHSHAFYCYECTGRFPSPCASALPMNMGYECLQEGATCYESIQSFAFDSFPIVIRDCYVPNNTDTNEDYCNTYNNPIGKLIKCRSCNSDGCNGDNYGSNGFIDNQQVMLTDFHYAGYKDADKKHFLDEAKYLRQLNG